MEWFFDFDFFFATRLFGVVWTRLDFIFFQTAINMHTGTGGS